MADVAAADRGRHPAGRAPERADFPDRAWLVAACGGRRVIDEGVRIGRPPGLLMIDLVPGDWAVRRQPAGGSRSDAVPPATATKATILPSGDTAGDSFCPAKSVSRWNSNSCTGCAGERPERSRRKRGQRFLNVQACIANVAQAPSSDPSRDSAEATAARPGASRPARAPVGRHAQTAPTTSETVSPEQRAARQHFVEHEPNAQMSARLSTGRPRACSGLM